MTTIERFMSKVSKQPSGCWEWTKCGDRYGYGTFRLDKKMQKAHRVAYTLLVGAIPQGLVLDHTCENRRCVCPDHLEAVTQQVNIQRIYHR